MEAVKEGYYQLIVVDSCYNGCAGRDTLEFVISKGSFPELEIAWYDQCTHEICLKVTPDQKEYSVTAYFDWNSDGIYDNDARIHDKFIIQCQENLPVNTPFNITVELEDWLYCTKSNTIEAFIPIPCCSDWFYQEGPNYPACLELGYGLTRLCTGVIEFKHYQKHLPDFSDVITSDEQYLIDDAYSLASSDPLTYQINNATELYPEVHRVFGTDAYGYAIEDFTGQAEMKIYYGKGYTEDVFEHFLRLFVLNERMSRWEIVSESYVDTSENVVVGKIGELGGIYTIMGYQVPRVLCLNFQAYPAPYRHQDDDLKFTYVLTENANTSVTIYTATGNLVRRMEFNAGEEGGSGERNGRWNEIAWDGTNDLGRLTSNGAYIAVLEAQSIETAKSCEELFKFGIAR
jgi:hypothetical protein